MERVKKMCIRLTLTVMCYKRGLDYIQWRGGESVDGLRTGRRLSGYFMDGRAEPGAWEQGRGHLEAGPQSEAVGTRDGNPGGHAGLEFGEGH